MSDKRHRVAQWATGHSGAKALEAVIQHPSYDLVACYVYILVNAIPNVVAAAPGIRTTVELPPIVPAFA